MPEAGSPTVADCPSLPHIAPALAAVMVLYAVDTDPAPALARLRSHVQWLVVVDNHPDGHPAVAGLSSRHENAGASAHPAFTVLHNRNLGGLAGAYNAARRWLDANAPRYEALVFVDDDSDPEVLLAMLTDAGVRALLAARDVAAVAPAHRDRATGLRAAHLQLGRWRWRYLPREVRGLQPVSFVINSMSIWRRDALSAIGPHNEWLGVDHVDTEYCLRARRLGLRVMLAADHEFAHSLGQRVSYRLLGRTLQSGGHGPARRRSIGRTTAWLGLRWAWREPAFALLCVARLGYEAVGIVRAESQRPAKLWALTAGAAHGVWSALVGTRSAKRPAPNDHP